MTPDKNAASHPARPEALLLHVLQSTKAALGQATAIAAQQKLTAFFAGVQKYQQSLMAPSRLPYDVIWKSGSVRLLSFSPKEAGGPAVVLVPSLINGWEIFDLDKTHSFIAHLAIHGVCTYVVDFGNLTHEGGIQTLSDVVIQRLAPAILAARNHAARPVILAGYCMGGLLTAATAAVHSAQEIIKGQIFIASPWDIEEGDPDFTRLVRGWAPLVWPRLLSGSPLPAYEIQSLFAMLDPDNAADKYTRFAAMADEDPAAARFVLTENWLQSCTDMPAGVGIDVLRDVYIENRPACGVWEIGGHNIDAKTIMRTPSLVIAGQRDRLVSPQTALALAKQLHNKGALVHTIQPDLGHIGLMASPRAPTLVWDPLLMWIKALN